VTSANTRTVETRDGRTLCVEVAGDGDRSVLIHGGTPNSRHLLPLWIESATARGARLISYDRPGYGGSTPQPGRSVAHAAADTQAIAAALGIDRLAVWGFSGGGPHALACAALLPELVVASATVGSVAPWDAPGLDFFSGMGEDNVEDLTLYLDDPAAAREKSRQDRDEAMQVDADGLVEAWKTLLSPVDAAALTGEFAQFVVSSIQDGLAPGDDGWWDDGVAHMSPWGFALDSVRVPVKVWHGRQDRFVPFQHGQWLVEHVSGAEAALSEQDGHLTLLLDRADELHDWLLAHF
jgi:pimeloyl-ACP methyl ester carboxylesterase